MPLNATPGASDANSYLTLAEADAYFDARLYSDAWTATVDADQEKALQWATRLIDANVCFTGSSSTTTQALAWPRTGMTYRNGGTVPDDEIPQDLKNATAELAFLLLSSDRTLESQIGSIGLTKLKAGPVELGFSNAEATFKTVPEGVTSLLPTSWLCEVTDPSRTEAIFELLTE